jgi:Uri superfamily endonuclease
MLDCTNGHTTMASGSVDGNSGTVTVMAMGECNSIPSRNDPSAAGAYVLAITIAAPIAVKLARKLVGVLNAGNYLYCGSARGPGGLRARLSRHIRRDKSIRWHVDQLTTQAFVKGVWTFPGGDECKLVKRLSFLQTPIQGFGSSDCRQCDSHLLDWPNWLLQGDLDRALASRMAELQSLRQSLL